MVKRMRKSKSKKRVQWGGSPTFAYTGDVITSAGGAPQSVWSSADPHCGTAVLRGGRRQRQTRRNQRGGGCGCMPMQRGGGSGNGGFHPVLNNDTIGMIPAYVRAPCPTPQMGGASEQLIQSYPSGYGLVQPYNSDNANFMEPARYGRNMMGGKRSRRNKNKNKRKSRR